MKIKNLIISAVIVLLAVCLCGCEEAKKHDVSETRLKAVKPPSKMPKMPTPAGGLTLSIESTAITADELIKPVKPQIDALAREYDYEIFSKKAKGLLFDVLRLKIADIKLYQKAKAALPENIDQGIIDKIVEQEVQRFIAHYGGNDATVEQMFKEMGTTREGFKEQQRRAILVQAFLSEELKDEKPITYSELVKYYESIKGESYTKNAFIEFRLIDLEIERFADANDPNVNADKKAMELAGQIEQKIKNGEDFAELAKKYSNDESAKVGGLWKPVRPGSLVEPYSIIEKTAEDMNAGDVSKPISAGGHIFIVKLENKQAQSCEPFEKVQTEVEGRYLFERKKKLVDETMKKIISQVDLTDLEANYFIEFCIEQAYNQAKKQPQR